MKKQTFVPIAVLLAFFVFLAGCATTETNAYKVIGTTANTVEAARKGWNDWIRAGKDKPGERAQAQAVYAKYQAAMKVAEAAVTSYRLNPADTTALNAALNALDASKNEIINLFATFYGELKP